MAVLAGAVRRLFEDPGPFFSLYLTHDRSDGEESWRRLWDQARRQLSQLGASEPLLARLELATLARPFPVTTYVAVASHGLTFTARLCATGSRPSVLVRAGALPHLLPVLRAEQETRRIVVVHLGGDRDEIAFWPDADFAARHGARLATAFPHRQPRWTGHDGQPCLRRGQLRHTDQHLAAALEIAAYEFRPEVVVVVGPGERVPALLARATDRLRHLVLTVDTPHATCAEAVAAAVALVAQRIQRDRDALLERVVAGGTCAVSGAAATLRALRAGALETLLLAESAGPGPQACYGQALCEVALDPGELGGDRPPVQADLLDVAVRAAAGADIDVWVIPDPGGLVLPDGVGGLRPVAPDADLALSPAQTQS